MAIDLSEDRTIALKRNGKKLWSWKGSDPDVVEIAVLHYLRDHGWDGFFTGREDYYGLIIALAGWPGKVSNKMNPAFTPSFVYFRGTDGLFRQHRYSYDKTMRFMRSITLAEMEERLRVVCAGKKWKRAYYSTNNQQPDHLISFLHAVGMDKIREIVESRYTKEKLAAQKTLRELDYSLDHLRWRKIGDNYPEARSTGEFPRLEWAVRDYEFGERDLIAQARAFASHLPSEVRQVASSAIDFAEAYRQGIWDSDTGSALDLVLWNAKGLAIAEVKAPNDRLRPHQRKTIDHARSQGSQACVISVVEDV